MKLFNVALCLLALNPAPSLSEKCSVCSGFDNSLDIDQSALETIFASDGADNNDPAPTSCNELKTAMQSMNTAADSTNCTVFNLMSFSFCGCNDPPVDSCFVCPDGTPIPDLDLVPSIPQGMIPEGSPDMADMTCGYLGLRMTFMGILFEGLADSLQGLGGVEGEQGSGDSGEDIDMSKQLCGVVGSLCGCGGGGCKICENGLENPSLLVKTGSGEDAQEFTCSQGVQLLEMQAVDDEMCGMIKNSAKEVGCKCIGSSDETLHETSCTICENGLKNPDFVVNDNGDKFTCAEGVIKLESMSIGEDASCEQKKNMAKEAGCVCDDSTAKEKNYGNSNSNSNGKSNGKSNGNSISNIAMCSISAMLAILL